MLHHWICFNISHLCLSELFACWIQFSVLLHLVPNLKILHCNQWIADSGFPTSRKTVLGHVVGHGLLLLSIPCIVKTVILFNPLNYSWEDVRFLCPHPLQWKWCFIYNLPKTSECYKFFFIPYGLLPGV